MGYYDSDKEGEKYCYGIYEKQVAPYIEPVPNMVMAGLYRLNKAGRGVYPRHKKEVFHIEQLMGYVFETGCNPFPFLNLINKK